MNKTTVNPANLSTQSFKTSLEEHLNRYLCVCEIEDGSYVQKDRHQWLHINLFNNEN